MKPEIDSIVKDNDFFSDFEQNTQEFVQPEIKPEVEIQEQVQNQQKTNAVLVKAIKKTNQLAAKTIVNSADNILALLLSIYALSDDIETYKLDENELSDLIELMESMMPEDKTFLPEWLLVVIGISTIYGKKIKTASIERKENKKKQKLEDAKYKKELKEYENEAD